MFVQSGCYFGKTSDLGSLFTDFENFRDDKFDNSYMGRECDNGVKSSDALKERACKYVQYAKNFPHRAYYYGTDITNLEIMEDYCRRNCKNYNCGDVNAYVF